jgi:diadenosine tetraphosphate (Ap4A) HIT family hydrolase
MEELMKRSLFFVFLCVIGANLCAQDAFGVLWSGQTVELISQAGVVALHPKRTALIEELSDEEKIELEESAAKMQNVFAEVFGFGDTIRWMKFGVDGVCLFFYPAGAYGTKGEVNVEYKMRQMLELFNAPAIYLPPLSTQALEQIKIAAAVWLTNETKQPILLQSETLAIKGLREARKLLNHETPPEFCWLDNANIHFSFSAICKAFCDPAVIQKQFIFESKYHFVIFNHRPYTKHHLMILPKRHITTLGENNREEILDKYALFEKLGRAARYLGCTEYGILTRIGWRSGQTQPHLHDHFLGFIPSQPQSWIQYWSGELNNVPLTPIQGEQAQTIRKLWAPFLQLPQ